MELTFAEMIEIEARKQQDYRKLQEAVMNHRYGVMKAALKKEKHTFFPDKAYELCSLAIRHNCSLEAFQTILQHCVPLEDFIDNGYMHSHVPDGYIDGTGGLLQEAAAWNNAPVLEYILDQGFSPNSHSKGVCSALEAALRGQAADSLKLLQRRENVDFTVTERILDVWAAIGMDEERDRCFRIVAGRLAGEEQAPDDEDLPLLPGMTILHAANRENWGLVCRLCYETKVTGKQGKQVLDHYMFHNRTLDALACAMLLDALFTGCPGLLRCEYPRYALALCMLHGGKGVTALLAPWVERMPGRMVTLCGRRLAEPDYDIVGCLKNWDERMGARLRPVLRRNKLLPVRSMDMTEDETIRFLLEHCAVRGTPPKDGVSRLAMDVLQLASPGLLVELFKEGKLFPEEDPTALLSYCGTQVYQRRQEKRNVLLAYCKKQVNYEL